MMTSDPVHHVPEDLLVEYVTGGCTASAALTIACHLSLCGVCAEEARGLEAVGGVFLETVAPQQLPPGALERLLKHIEALPIESAPDVPASDATFDLLLPTGVPRLVRPYVSGGVGARWRRLVPGVTRIDLQVGGPTTVARLVSLRPGLEIPLHDHGGTEYTVIFSGALDDERGRFARGDISIREPGERHIQRVGAHESCVAIVVNDGPLLPLTWKGQLLTFLSGFSR